MRRRRESDPISEALVVVMPDGHRLRCSIDAIGRESQPRWVVLDDSGEQHMGPLAESDKSAEAVQRLITDWWQAQGPRARKERRSGPRIVPKNER